MRAFWNERRLETCDLFRLWDRLETHEKEESEKVCMVIHLNRSLCERFECLIFVYVSLQLSVSPQQLLQSTLDMAGSSPRYTVFEIHRISLARVHFGILILYVRYLPLPLFRFGSLELGRLFGFACLFHFHRQPRPEVFSNLMDMARPIHGFSLAIFGSALEVSHLHTPKCSTLSECSVR